ncbi:MAG: carboxypeptidase-like regulatory domain-containing protein, partial [Propionibacteriales bacterium]|nr:carboxypeptidase-like regulatory domain-containing protein [Propionibacteriales bacterium]
QQIIGTLVARGYDLYVSPQRAGGTVAGVVTDTQGTPVGGAVVTADTGQHTTTAADGTYTLVQLKPGVRTLTFTKANYATTTQTPTIDADLPATADATMAGVAGTISGTVSASTGALISGATVALDGTPITTTAADGSYTLPAGAGSHTVTVTKAYYLTGTATPTVPAGSGVTANVTLAPVQLTQTITRAPAKSTITVTRKHGKATVTLSAIFADARGAIPGQSVRLQRSTNGKTKWKTVYTRVTTTAGKATVVFTTKKRQTVYYRWYAPTTAADLTKTSTKQKVRIR